MPHGDRHRCRVTRTRRGGPHSPSQTRAAGHPTPLRPGTHGPAGSTPRSADRYPTTCPLRRRSIRRRAKYLESILDDQRQDLDPEHERAAAVSAFVEGDIRVDEEPDRQVDVCPYGDVLREEGTNASSGTQVEGPGLRSLLQAIGIAPTHLGQREVG